MKALIVKTSSMGDILHTLPALTDTMHTIPSIRFDWVVEENFEKIPSWHVSVDRVFPIAIRRWRKHLFCKKQREEFFHFKQDLHLREYDIVIDAQGLIKSAIFVTRLSRGIKHGMNSRSVREPLSSLWYDKCHEINKKQHAIERIRELFAKSLGYKKPQTQGDYAISLYFLAKKPIDVDRYLVFLHATTKNNKHWPENYWYKLISLLEPTGFRIKLPWNSRDEYQRAQRLAANFNHVEILPKLSLEQIALILSGAKAVVSVDTGLSHLTAALNRPNLTLYGPTDPTLIGSYGPNQKILTAQKKGRMASISVTQVNDALQSLLSMKNR